MSHFNQGIYRPINPSKFNFDNPSYLSGWELAFLTNLDRNPRILKVIANKFFISYFSRTDNKNKRYYLDMVVDVLNTNNTIQKLLIEIKPDAKISPPKQPKRNTPKSTKNFNYSILESVKNNDKWIFADQYARANGGKFIILTEKGMYVMQGQNLRKVSDKSFF